MADEPRWLEKIKEMKIYKKIIICFIAYFIISMITIPFINSIWFGELPVLAVIQLPKVIPANAIRRYYAVSLAKELNISKGSFSPDYGLARPYALSIIYIIPLLILVFYALCIKNKKESGKYLLFFLFFSTLDYLFMLHFSHTPGLTIY